MISNRLWKILVTFKSCKTLSATAERLFVSQPSISSSMKMLEKELGVQLFDRSKNKIVLNEVGLEAAQLAEDYLKREDFMVRQIQEKAWQMRTLTVASYIFNLRKDLVSRLSVLFPEMCIRDRVAGVRHHRRTVRRRVLADAVNRTGHRA